MQELDDVKNLLQMTLDETKAWCNDNKCLGRAEDATQTISTQDQTEDIRREASSTSRTTDDNGHEGSPIVRDSSVGKLSFYSEIGLRFDDYVGFIYRKDHYSQLRQAIEESHQSFLASIHGVHQSRLLSRAMHTPY